MYIIFYRRLKHFIGILYLIAVTLSINLKRYKINVIRYVKFKINLMLIINKNNISFKYVYLKL